MNFSDLIDVLPLCYKFKLETKMLAGQKQFIKQVAIRKQLRPQQPVRNFMIVDRSQQ